MDNDDGNVDVDDDDGISARDGPEAATLFRLLAPERRNAEGMALRVSRNDPWEGSYSR